MKIENIYACPKCDFAVTGQTKPKYCRECGYSFIENNFLSYTTPITISEQLLKLNDLSGARDAVLSLKQEKALAILDDALKILETIGGRKTATLDIRPIVERAIAIGKIGEAYDNFIKAGGKHVPSLYLNNNNEVTKDEPSNLRTSPAGTISEALVNSTEGTAADDKP